MKKKKGKKPQKKIFVHVLIIIAVLAVLTLGFLLFANFFVKEVELILPEQSTEALLQTALEGCIAQENPEGEGYLACLATASRDSSICPDVYCRGWVLFGKAVDDNSRSACDLIEYGGMKNVCSESLSSGDTSICKKAQTKSEKEDCKLLVTALSSQQDKAAVIEQFEEADFKFMASALLLKDSNVCKEIHKAECYMDYYIDTAKATGDPGYCDKIITNLNDVEKCKAQFVS